MSLRRLQKKKEQAKLEETKSTTEKNHLPLATHKRYLPCRVHSWHFCCYHTVSLRTSVMAVHERSQLPVNGGPDLHQPDVAEIREYEKILTIHDQIFSGNHPRLKVPPHVVRKVTPRSVQASPVSGSRGGLEPSAIPKSKPQWVSQSGAPWKNSNSSSINDSPPIGSVPVPSHTPASRISTKTTSEIDPIFLTKSDDLVRAEIQLQRQRIERSLRDQVEQKKIEARHQVIAQDSKPDFDVTNVLHKALEIAKPVEPSEVQRANRNTTASDSFDENSFYSSRAPDSPQHGDQRPASPQLEQQAHPMEIDDLDADAPVDHRFRTVQQVEPSNSHTTDQETENAPYAVSGKRAPSPKQPENARHNYLPQEHADAYEEPEYSPPGPDIPVSRKASQDYNRRGMDTRRRASGRMSGRGQNGRRSMSPRDVRVVRNHITSPAAPQPSRVSPLAVAKVPSITQVRPERHMETAPTGHDSARASPEAPVQPVMSRKRRRMRDSGDAMRHVAPRQAAESPRPYIKEEPVSPPPFSDVPAPITTRNRQAPEKPVYVDTTSPQYTPVPERREYNQRKLAYEPNRYVKRYDMASPVEPNIVRTPSQIGYRRPVRDNQDLRRVASLQHARQPEIPQDYPEPGVQPRSMRATSYAVVERPPQPERTSRYYEEPLQSYPRRYIQPEDEPVAPASSRFRDNYDEMEIEPRVMAPPQRRIVVDEHGNQYYESALPKVQQLPPARHAKVDSYHEGPRVRNGSMRAASVVEDSYGERRYVQEMPPPPPTYRRVTDYARSVVPERRPYTREYDDKEPIMRSESVQVMDYPPRHHAPYVDDHGLPREDVIRVASVRPQHRQYEEPREMVQRVQSVRPGGREVSVYVDDEQRQPREYIPMDKQGYGIARSARDERFYGDDDGDRMVMDGGREVHRLPSRY